EAWHGRANILCALKQYDAAFAAYDRALTLNPRLAEAWLGRGNVFSELKRYPDAINAYDTALALKRDINCASSYRLHAKLQICDWMNLDDETKEVLASVRASEISNAPFTMLGIPSSAAEQLQCAKRFLQDMPIFSEISPNQKY